MEAEDGPRSGKDHFEGGGSFQSWKSYAYALFQTPGRFKDRLYSRSDETSELEEVRKRSENDMKRTLSWWDLIWFGFGGVMGAGIFVLTGQEAHDDAGPAIVISYAASGFAVMLSVFCYTEFAVEIPVADCRLHKHFIILKAQAQLDGRGFGFGSYGLGTARRHLDPIYSIRSPTVPTPRVLLFCHGSWFLSRAFTLAIGMYSSMASHVPRRLVAATVWQRRDPNPFCCLDN